MGRKSRNHLQSPATTLVCLKSIHKFCGGLRRVSESPKVRSTCQKTIPYNRRATFPMHFAWIRSARPAKVGRKRSKTHSPRRPPMGAWGRPMGALWVLAGAFASPWPVAHCESRSPGLGIGFAFRVEFGDLLDPMMRSAAAADLAEIRSYA